MKRMIKIGVIGVGRMGKQIISCCQRQGHVKVFDIDNVEATRVAMQYRVICCQSIEDMLDCTTIFLAVPGETVMAIIGDYVQQAPQELIWISVSTLLTARQLRETYPSYGNVISVKIIGVADAMQLGIRPVLVLDPAYDLILHGYVLSLLDQVGEVVHDFEDKYVAVNLMSAEAAMTAVIWLAKQLKASGIANPAVITSIRNVFLGTASQFPYQPSDYFHELIFARHPDLQVTLELLNLQSAPVESVLINS